MRLTVEQKLEYAQRAIKKSQERIRQGLSGWDFEKYGEITHRKLSERIKMNIGSVYRHYPMFADEIKELNELNEKEK